MRSPSASTAPSPAPRPTFGQSTHEGIILAVDEANAKGGVLGKKIVVKTEDDAGNQDQAVSVVKKLINRDGVVAVLGEVASTNSLAGGGGLPGRQDPDDHAVQHQPGRD